MQPCMGSERQKSKRILWRLVYYTLRENGFSVILKGGSTVVEPQTGSCNTVSPKAQPCDDNRGIRIRNLDVLFVLPNLLPSYAT